MENNQNTQQIPVQNQAPQNNQGGGYNNGYNQQYNQQYGQQQYSQQQPLYNSRYSQPYGMPKEKNNNTVIIALVAALAVLLISLAVIIAVITINGNKSDVATTPNVVDVSGGATEKPEAPKPSESEKNGTLVTDSFDTSIFVRSGPGKEYTKVMEIAAGDRSVKLRYTGTYRKGRDGYIWYEVVTPFGRDAWVRSDIVVFED